MANIVLVYMYLNYETLEGKGHTLFKHVLQDVPCKTQICSLADWTHVLVMWSQSWTLCLPDLRYPSLPQGSTVFSAQVHCQDFPPLRV